MSIHIPWYICWGRNNLERKIQSLSCLTVSFVILQTPLIASLSILTAHYTACSQKNTEIRLQKGFKLYFQRNVTWNAYYRLKFLPNFVSVLSFSLFPTGTANIMALILTLMWLLYSNRIIPDVQYVQIRHPSKKSDGWCICHMLSSLCFCQISFLKEFSPLSSRSICMEFKL